MNLTKHGAFALSIVFDVPHIKFCSSTHGSRSFDNKVTKVILIDKVLAILVHQLENDSLTEPT